MTITNMPTISAADADLAKEQRLAEYRKGGDQAPCPMCRTPRFQRSDYVRCCVCGVNWLRGEDLDRHPSIQRRIAQQTGAESMPLPTKRDLRT